MISLTFPTVGFCYFYVIIMSKNMHILFLFENYSTIYSERACLTSLSQASVLYSLVNEDLVRFLMSYNWKKNGCLWAF